ncbi:MAG: carbon storage regulator CsrA [Planctomycetota bacterium]
MLVLSRKQNETIMIGDEIEVLVVDIRGDKVRLGITAPRQTPVHRREIYDIRKAAAASLAAGAIKEPYLEDEPRE